MLKQVKRIIKEPKKIPFKITPTPIDYFEIKDEYFPKEDFAFYKDVIALDDSERYLVQEKHLPTLNLDKKETVVLNCQVGKGKTTLFYELIRQYYDKGFLIIVCSPFVKLVKKDFKEITEFFPEQYSKLFKESFRNADVFYADNLYVDDERAGFFYKYAETAPKRFGIHVMTINLLLGNSGEDTVEQNYYKRLYIDNLLKATSPTEEDEKLKVVLFLDEVHESVHNFRSRLIPNLLRWRNRIEKVFIASATFTPASIPLIKAVSLLTDKTIKVYETHRVKHHVQASIHLHIFVHPYHSKASHFTSIVKNKIQEYNKQGRAVNVLTSSKALSKKLAEACFSTVVDAEDKLRPDNSLDFCNLATAETKVLYQPGQNNVGTTFKTGVNAQDADAAFLVVLPTLNKEPKYQHYGIFTDGIPSIIQAIGRQRNGGDIHLFMYDPDVCIGDKALYPTTFQAKVEFDIHKTLNSSYDYVSDDYNKRFDKLQSEIQLMEAGLKAMRNEEKESGLDGYKNKFGFWYPNLQEFLLNNSRSVAMKYKNPSFGRLLSPYVLWASLNDQFANARLNSVYYYNYSPVKDLSPKIAYKVFSEILERQHKEITQMGFRKSLSNLGKLLGTYVGENGHTSAITFRIKKAPGEVIDYQKEKIVSAAVLLNREPGFSKIAISILYYIATDATFDFDEKVDYLNSCITEAENIAPEDQETELIRLYSNLSKLKREFADWVRTQTVAKGKLCYVSNKAHEKLPEDITKKAAQIIKQIRQADYVITSKAISWMQNINIEDAPALRKSIFNELRCLTYRIIQGRTQINGESYTALRLQKPNKPCGFLRISSL